MATEQQVQELKEKMAAERSRLLSQLESLSEEQAGAALKHDDWTARQQMAHLCEMESAYRAWVEKALREDNPDLGGVGGEPVAIPLERANLHTAAELIAEMCRQRDKTLAIIDAMRPEDFDRPATSPMFGTLTVLQWLRSYYRHDRMHHDQVRGEEPEYRPRFVGGKEPDQRRPAAGA